MLGLFVHCDFLLKHFGAGGVCWKHSAISWARIWWCGIFVAWLYDTCIWSQLPLLTYQTASMLLSPSAFLLHIFSYNINLSLVTKSPHVNIISQPQFVFNSSAALSLKPTVSVPSSAKTMFTLSFHRHPLPIWSVHWVYQLFADGVKNARFDDALNATNPHFVLNQMDELFRTSQWLILVCFPRLISFIHCTSTVWKKLPHWEPVYFGLIRIKCLERYC